MMVLKATYGCGEMSEKVGVCVTLLLFIRGGNAI
jgi:hypothetical protein